MLVPRLSLALALPLLLAACGGGGSDRQAALTPEQYQQGVREAVGGDTARAASAGYLDVVANQHGTEVCADKVRRLRDHLDALLSQVDGLVPPADAEVAQREFLEAARDSARLVGVAAEDVAGGRLSCGQPLNERIYGMPSTVRAEAAIADLEEVGYLVFGD